MKGWRSEVGRLIKAGAALESILLALHLHALSLIHCLPPSPSLSLSVSFPYSHILLSSSTYFLGGGGGGCRYTTRSSVWETQSKTGTDSPRCTDHSAGLHSLSSPRCCSLILHLKFALCLCWGLLSCHISPVNLLLLLNGAHTNTWALLLWSFYISVITVPAGQVACDLRHYTSLTSIDCEWRMWSQREVSTLQRWVKITQSNGPFQAAAWTCFSSQKARMQCQMSNLISYSSSHLLSHQCRPAVLSALSFLLPLPHWKWSLFLG